MLVNAIARHLSSARTLPSLGEAAGIAGNLPVLDRDQALGRQHIVPG